MKDKHPELDRNFDDLAQRFQRQIYDSMKGRLRLAILRRDFAEAVPTAPLRVLDIGAGQGQWALEMLAAGHSVLLTDLSHTMLEASRQRIAESDLSELAKQQARWLQCSVQELADRLDETFDLIVCHAVMEWLEQPFQLLRWIEPLLAPRAWVSLIFYNRDGLIFKNLLRANYAKVEKRDFRGSKGGLTPLNPLAVDEVLGWTEAADLELVCRSGIRVFHDYVLDKQNYQKDPEGVERLELAYSRIPPFRDLGRYQHFLLRKK
jgi:S-adenosylmethionine-dependent methyltransferase